jgi:hypothetical protein
MYEYLMSTKYVIMSYTQPFLTAPSPMDAGGGGGGGD